MSGMSSRALWTVIGIILVPCIVVPLLVGIYDRTDPVLFGFPFFFWFQFLLIIAVTSLTGFCYWLSLLAERKSRVEQGRDAQ